MNLIPVSYQNGAVYDPTGNINYFSENGQINSTGPNSFAIDDASGAGWSDLSSQTSSGLYKFTGAHPLGGSTDYVLNTATGIYYTQGSGVVNVSDGSTLPDSSGAVWSALQSAAS